MTLAKRALLVLFLAAPLVACASSDDTQDGDDAEFEEDLGATEEALKSAVSCDGDTQPAYSRGARIGSVETYKIGGKRVSHKTGNAFLYLQKKAHAKGFNIWINSGFRTMAEQTYFHRCYTTRSCNNGNLAARPGFSNHQNGRALDIGTNNRSKLNRLIDELNVDWRNTVASEAWHYEYFGSDPGGPCD